MGEKKREKKIPGRLNGIDIFIKKKKLGEMEKERKSEKEGTNIKRKQIDTLAKTAPTKKQFKGKKGTKKKKEKSIKKHTKNGLHKH
jgi:hypothetical protein